MDDVMLVSFNFNGQRMALPMNNPSSLVDLRLKLTEKGVGPHILGMKMSSYFHEKDGGMFQLLDQQDWDNMLMLMKHLGYKVVHITGAVSTNSTTNNPHFRSDVVRSRRAPSQSSGSTGSAESDEEQLMSSVRFLDDEDGEYSSDEEQDEPLIDPGWKVVDAHPRISAGWAYLIKNKGQTFKVGAPHFRVDLAKFSLECGFKFRFIQNTRERIRAVCAKKDSDGCQWSIMASRRKATGWFEIKKLNNSHSCPLSVKSNKRVSSTLISLLIVDKLRQRPTTSPDNVVNICLDGYGLIVEYMKAWRAVEKARSLIFGNYNDSYQELRWYAKALEHKNPGSYVQFEVHPDTNRFHRFFLSFHASIDGFQHCRPMLFLDGTFLKSRYQGCLLSATGKDGGQGLYPLALAVVDSEDKENWSWFMKHLMNVLGPNRDVLFVTDRNVTLMEVFNQEYPDINNFYCLFHLKLNLRDRYGGKGHTNGFRDQVVDLLRQCARARTQHMFQRNYKK